MAVVLMAGSSGFLGTSLIERLRAGGHEVRRLVRRETREPDEIRWDPAAGSLDAAALEGVTHVLNLAGAGVGDRRWTPARKQTILSSRVSSTTLLARRIAECGNRELALVNASAVGFYGDAGEQVCTEDTPAGDSFLAEVCRAWEQAADPARAAGNRVVHLRTGIVLDPSGGALARMMPLIRFGLAGPLGNGRQWWPWITREDVLGAIEHLLLSTETAGPVNLSAPESLRNREVVAALAAAAGRPAVLPAPRPALRLALGEFATELTASQRAVPAALQQSGYEFVWPEIGPAAAHLMSARST
ncbi:TIGR01777 family oxidoreductase [Ruania suaedae]|uniref:TIGR01777 family oxidoreductase n=1 Tax=Ruania suaedae TaxID=2897774 RepID=UPI001E527540|nr:TIGR01777 family oxidoreductase [Ruania suaedae]UFU01658.1 TIGR01777 family oxidoreductase [Ruania suaedae]